MEAYEKGIRFEERIIKLLGCMGYNEIKQRKIFPTGEGNFEIDITAIENETTDFFECKDHASRIGGEELKYFVKKCELIDKSAGRYFISKGGFTDDAVTYSHLKQLSILDECDVLDLEYKTGISKEKPPLSLKLPSFSLPSLSTGGIKFPKLSYRRVNFDTSSFNTLTLSTLLLPFLFNAKKLI